ncbi:MAG: M23 family metallopeptidase [Clostridia bacterium]
MEDIINEKVLTSESPCAVFTTLNVKPTYELILSNTEATDENKVAEILSENTTTLYKVYALTINDEAKTYVNTLEEAENIIEEMKSEYENSLVDVNISILEQFTENIEDIGTVELAVAMANIDTDLRQIKVEQEKIAASTINGVYFEIRPVIGNITSRYGAVESIRDHTHTGLDIAAPAGTDIKASANGVVSYSGWMSGYGYLIIIDHENGVQSYYGHCSKLYANVGEEVLAGDIIAAVGSTGNSTGNHLHFEIRINGSPINPQKYIYN